MLKLANLLYYVVLKEKPTPPYVEHSRNPIEPCTNFRKITILKYAHASIYEEENESTHLWHQ